MGKAFEAIAEDELAEERGSFQRMLAALFESDSAHLGPDPMLQRDGEEGEDAFELRLRSI
jgi:hypothetical protein